MKRRVSLAILAILGMVALACSPCGLMSSFTGGEEGVELVQPSAEPDGEQPTSPPESSGEEPTSPPEPGDVEPTSPPESDDGAPEVVELSTLNSYQVRQVIRVEDKKTSESHEIVLLEEWVREPPARHITMSGENLDTELIAIGDKLWVYAGDSWVETSSEGSMDFSESMDIAPDLGVGAELVGRESVNGVDCEHYTFDYEDFSMTDPEEGTVTVGIQGEVWIADEPGIPPIVVRQHAQLEGRFMPIPGASASSDEEDAVTYFEKDVTDINVPITIEPPQ